jgi:hypothetical protein
MIKIDVTTLALVVAVSFATGALAIDLVRTFY